MAVGEVEMEFSFTVKIGSSTSCNVIAVIPGKSEETIIVNAHHDSVLTPGAVDDVSGVAVILEMARLLSKGYLSRPVMFVTFGGEQLGLLGSADFVNRRQTDNAIGVITVDSIAPGLTMVCELG